MVCQLNLPRGGFFFAFRGLPHVMSPPIYELIAKLFLDKKKYTSYNLNNVKSISKIKMINGRMLQTESVPGTKRNPI